MSLLRDIRDRERARRAKNLGRGVSGSTGLSAPVGAVAQRSSTVSAGRRDVLPGAVGNAQIGDGAVQAPQLADSSVTSPALADGSVTGPKVPAGALTARELADGSVTVPKFVQGTRPVQLVDTLPVLPDDDFPPGAAVLHMGDGKIYRHSAPDDVWGETWLADWPASEGWTAQVDTFDLRGLIEEGQVGVGAVTAGTVAANAIGATELAAIYVEVDKWIRSFNWSPGVAGWAIDGDGNVEFNDGTFRGNLEAVSVTAGQLVSSNYSAGTAGWALDASGNAELNDATFRGNIKASSVTSGQLVSSGYLAGSSGWALDSNGNVEFNDGTFRGNVSGAAISGSTLTAGSVVINADGIYIKQGIALDRKLKFGEPGFGTDQVIYASTTSTLRIESNSVVINGDFVVTSIGRPAYNGKYLPLADTTRTSDPINWLGATYGTNGTTGNGDGDLGWHTHAVPYHTHTITL